MAIVANKSGKPAYRSILTLGTLQVIIDSEIPGIIREMDDIYSAAPIPPPVGEDDYPTTETRSYQISSEEEQPEGSPRFRITGDDETLRRNARQEDLSRFLEWSITDAVSRALTGYHRVHAGAIAGNGKPLIPIPLSS